MPLKWEVPAADVLAFAPKRSRYALCVFVINEGARIHRQLARMRPWCGDVDVFLVDGGSTDGSTDPERLRAAGVHTLLTKRGPGKLSAQMRMGLAHAVRNEYEGVLVMDGNDKDDPNAIPRFVEALNRGFDHVQGSRFVPGGQAVNTPASRYWGIRLIHAPLVSMASGFRYTDTTNGFRAYSSRLLLDDRVRPFRDVFSAYELHYYLAIRAAELGFRVCEVPVTRAYPDAGPVPTKLHGVGGNVLVLRTLLAACLRRFHPHGV